MGFYLIFKIARNIYIFRHVASYLNVKGWGGGAQIHPKNLNTQKKKIIKIKKDRFCKLFKWGGGGGRRALCYVPDFDFDVFLIINHFRKTKIC